MSIRENHLRLYRWRLQERQDYLAGLESLLERLRNDARRFGEEAGGGPRPAALPQDGGVAYPVLVRPLVERQRKIERSITEVETQIAEAQALVAAALQEVKLCEGVMGPHAAAVPVQATRRARRKRHSSPFERTRSF